MNHKLDIKYQISKTIKSAWTSIKTNEYNTLCSDPIPDQDYWDTADDDIIAFFSAAVGLGLSHSLQQQRCCNVSVQVLTSTTNHST